MLVMLKVCRELLSMPMMRSVVFVSLMLQEVAPASVMRSTWQI